jgi:hypothetical protein
MSGLLGMLGQHIDQNTISQISNQAGTDPSTTEKAIAAALPSLLGGMAQHASTDQGAAEIHQAVQSAPADGAVPTATLASGGLLGRILGPHESSTTQQVAQASGINTQQAGKVLLALAPLAVAVLARRHAQDPAAAQQPGGLSSILHQAASNAQTATSSGGAGALGGLLGRILG